MTKANLFTWLSSSYPFSSSNISSTPDNNGTKPQIVEIEPWGIPKLLTITSGYAKYYRTYTPHWMKIWNVTRGDYLWGKMGAGADWLEFEADIPATWQVNDELSNAVDGAGSTMVEVWMTTVPSTATAVEVILQGIDTAPAGAVMAYVASPANISYLTVVPLSATMETYLGGMCKVTDSKLRYNINSSGANTFGLQIKLHGYYTEVDIIPPTTSRIVSPKGVQIA